MNLEHSLKLLVEDRIAAILSSRPGSSKPADKALRRAVDLYVAGTGANYTTLVKRRNELEALLKSDIPEVSMTRAQHRSLSRKKAAAVLTAYEPRPQLAGERYLISGYQYTFILKSHEIWFLASIDPGGIQEHLLRRIGGRLGNNFDVVKILDDSANIWNPLLWMRGRRVQEGRGFIPHDFFTPFEGGLLFGHFEKLTNAEEAAPHLAVVSTGAQRNTYLPDAYAEGGLRVWAQTNTFVDASKLKAHQLLLRDRLVYFAKIHGEVIDALKLAWKISAHSSNPDSNELKEMLGVSFPERSRMESMCQDLERIVDSEEWQREAEFSRSSRERHRADVARRAPSDAV